MPRSSIIDHIQVINARANERYTICRPLGQLFAWINHLLGFPAGRVGSIDGLLAFDSQALSIFVAAFIPALCVALLMTIPGRLHHRTAFEEIQTLKDQLYKENLVLREEVDRASMFEEIVGTSAGLQRVIARISKVVPSDSTVLITGETGTGKELIAHAIHKRSKPANRAFVSVNCAALAQSLIGSELFGHERARSQERSNGVWAALDWRTAGRSFWTKWASYRPKLRLVCCVRFRNINSSVSDALSDSFFQA